MDGERAPGSGEDRARACHGCGWSGTDDALRWSGPGEVVIDPLVSACPRCGSPVVVDPPSVQEVLAARRTPEP